MERKCTHLIEIDSEGQQWIERYAEIKDLSIQETLARMLIAGRSALERQEVEISRIKNNDPELPPRVKIGVQASVECLAILRKIHLPDINDQKKLALEVKHLIEETIRQTVQAKE